MRLIDLEYLLLFSDVKVLATGECAYKSKGYYTGRLENIDIYNPARFKEVLSITPFYMDKKVYSIIRVM